MAPRGDPSRGLSSPDQGHLSLSFFMGFLNFFFLSECVELSVASQQGILDIIYPLLH